MRKLLYLLLLIPLGFLAACDDDNDLPDVELTVTFENAVRSRDNGQLYVTSEDGIDVSSVTCAGIGEKAAITNVEYYLDYGYVGVSVAEGFGARMPDLAPGRHLLVMNFSVLQVDKSIARARLQYVVNVVENASDLPGGAEPGQVVDVMRCETHD